MSNKTKYFYCHVEGNTDVGCKRKVNEDWLDSFECENGLVAVVCDGMGGHVGGQIASHVAVDTIRNFLKTEIFSDPREAIKEACNAANQAILQRTLEQPELTGMGSTCVMLIVRDGKVYMGSVGDSRIYLVRSKTIRQLTKDQSYVQMLVDAGQITQEQAEHHPRKNEITNALGLADMKPATVLEDSINPEAGDCFVLCSDGLSGMVADCEIAKVVSNQMGKSQQERVNTLIDKARRNGGVDNITCQIVEFSVTPDCTKPSSLKDTILKKVMPALFALGAVSGLSYIGWHTLFSEKKESQYVQDMKKEATELKYIDTLNVSDNKKDYLEIEEIKDLGIKFYVHNYDNSIDTTSINLPLHLSSMSVTPDKNFKVTKDGLRCTVKFNSREYSDPDMAVTFKVNNDSTYCYVFTVEKSSNSGTIAARGSSGAATTTPPKDTNSTGTVIFDKTSIVSASTDPSVKYTDLPIDVQINIPNRGSTNVSLTSKQGDNTNQQLFTDYAIQVCEKNGKWYNYVCKNGQECTITINGSMVPQDSKQAIIRIKLANCDKEYIIRVTTAK